MTLPPAQSFRAKRGDSGCLALLRVVLQLREGQLFHAELPVKSGGGIVPHSPRPCQDEAGGDKRPKRDTSMCVCYVVSTWQYSSGLSGIQ